MVRLQRRPRAEFSDTMCGELGTRSQWGRRRSRSVEDRKKDRAEELVELHLRLLCEGYRVPLGETGGLSEVGSSYEGRLERWCGVVGGIYTGLGTE